MKDSISNTSKECKSKGKAEISLVAFLIVRVIMGLVRVFDYGLSFDEGFGHVQMLKNKEYMEGVIGAVLGRATFADTQWYDSWMDKYYGVASRSPLYFGQIEQPVFGQMRETFQMYHLYQYLLFVIAVFALYKLGVYLGYQRTIALLGSVMLVMMPRMYAEAAYNYKDMTFLCLFIISLALAFWLIERWNWKRMLLFSLVTALSTNTRYLGGVVLFYVIIAHMFLEKDGGKRAKNLLGMLVVFLAIYYAVSPFLWEHPLRSCIEMITKFSAFDWQNAVLFDGTVYMAKDLPRSYLLAWMGMTIPVWILFLIVIGLYGGIREAVCTVTKKKNGVVGLRDPKTLGRVFCFMLLAGVLLSDLLFHPLKYDGWRHFYFLYVLLIVIAMTGVEQILKCSQKVNVKIGIFAILTVLGLSDLMWMEMNHPFEYMYFNPLMRPVADRFEGDYWLVSTYNAAEELLKYETEKPIKVWTTYDLGFYFVSEKKAEKIVSCGNFYEADAVIFQTRAERYYDLSGINWSDYAVLSEKAVDGNLVYAIFLRKDSELYDRYMGEN